MKEGSSDKGKKLDDFEIKFQNALASNEQDKKNRRIEILSAILLSLATGSAWCAYQSTLWSSIQTSELEKVSEAGRLASENSVKSLQIRSLDGNLFIEYLNSEKSGNKEMSNFYYSRFDPILKAATDDWLKTDPFNNNNAPHSPFYMEKYQLKEDSEIINQLTIFSNKRDSANNAGKVSDNYVLLALMFAVVLFFGGIANTFESKLLRTINLLISAIIFIAIITVLFGLPVANVD